MKKGSATCTKCGAAFRRLELSSQPGSKGEYRCPACHNIIEVLDGSNLVVYRPNIQPKPRRRAAKRKP
jgi:hypothetical protein